MGIEWKLPERLQKTDGSTRRIGVEIELQGIEISRLAEITADVLGGTAERVSLAEYTIDIAQLGEFRVEVDFALLKELALEREKRTGDEGLMDFAVEMLGSASALLVPCEIVTPPIPMDSVGEPMEALVERLRSAGAKGTRDSVLYAFGVHLNIEPPEMDAETVRAYLRSFVLLYDWIVDEGQIDPTRRISPYIKPYADAYDVLIANPDYSADWPQLIADYLEHNPTRDRAMDMLPMFSEVDESRVRNTVDDPLIKPRPAFHYRLPNCCVDEPEWSIALPWQRWMRVEQLAGDGETLEDCMRAFIADRSRMLWKVDRRWIRDVTKWLND